jgi:CRISPR/Cas system-associated exonuclease Cas4 (RecB family)
MTVNRISVSAVKSFLFCQRQYYLSNINKIHKKVPSVHFVFGTAFHQANEAVWFGKAPDFDKAWAPLKHVEIDYLNKGTWQSFREKGLVMAETLFKFMKGKVSKKPKPLVELADPIDIGGITLSRRLDVVAEFEGLPAMIDGDGLTISGLMDADLKTSGRKYHPNEAKTSLQLMGYMVPIQAIKVEPEYSIFIVVTKTKKPEVQIVGTKVTREKIDAYTKLFSAVADQINTIGTFAAHYCTECNWCDYKALCYHEPDWKDVYVKSHKPVEIEPPDPQS